MTSSRSAPTSWVNTQYSSPRPHSGSDFLKTRLRELLRWDTGTGSGSILSVSLDRRKYEGLVYVLSWFLQVAKVPGPGPTHGPRSNGTCTTSCQCLGPFREGGGLRVMLLQDAFIRQVLRASEQLAVRFTARLQIDRVPTCLPKT